MLSSLLTNLQTLISGRFVISAFFPILTFWILNGAMAAWLNAPFRAWFKKVIAQPTVGQSSFILATLLIGTALSAYLYSALLPAIQSILEGRWPPWLVRLFLPPQVHQLEMIEEQVRKIRRLRGGLENPIPPKTKPPFQDWRDRLRDARRRGHDSHGGVNRFTRSSDGAIEVRKLETLRRRNTSIDAASLERAVMAMVMGLENNDADAVGPAGGYDLEGSRSALRELIDYAVDHAKSEDMRLGNKVRFSFGLQRPAPTLMGNVANTIQSYAEQRYKLNFEVFWTRMQRAIQKDKDFGPILQQEKTQLDFLVSCTSLTVVWWLVWSTSLASMKAGREHFLLVAVGGPIMAYAWYRIAVAQYRTFADVLRTSIDLFRFDMLSDLHFALPADVSDERDVWETLHKLTQFAEPINLHYQHPKDR